MVKTDHVRKPRTLRRERFIAFQLGFAAFILVFGFLELACRYSGNSDVYAHDGGAGAGPAKEAGRASAGASCGIVPEPPSPVKAYEPVSLPEGGKNSIQLLPGRYGPDKRYTGSIESKRAGDGSPVFSVKYLTDEFGRRVTPGEDKKHAGRFLLLMGDSFVYGQGLNQSETLAAGLGKALPGCRVYNYGIPGLMPGQLLDRARAIAGAGELPEKSGTLLYFFDNRQVPRNMSAFWALGDWGWDKPFYCEDKDGRIVAKGTHTETRPIRAFLGKMCWKSRLLRSSRCGWLMSPGKADWLFQIKLLRQLREAAGGFGADKFWVVLYPDNPGAERLVPYLEKAGINYIDLSRWNMSTLTKGSHYIPGDGHPSAESNQALAGALLPLIRKTGAI